jgi:hypothetical protein
MRRRHVPKKHCYSGVLATPFTGTRVEGKGLLGGFGPPEMTKDEWVERAVALSEDLGLGEFDIKKHGLDVFWREMLTRLAARHVPGFRPIQKSGGAPRKWTFELRRRLLEEVEAKRKESGLSELAICKALSKRSPYRELGRGARGATPETLVRKLQEAKADRKRSPSIGFFGLGLAGTPNHLLLMSQLLAPQEGSPAPSFAPVGGLLGVAETAPSDSQQDQAETAR